jgi:hypothetical protein
MPFGDHCFAYHFGSTFEVAVFSAKKHDYREWELGVRRRAAGCGGAVSSPLQEWQHSCTVFWRM